MGHPETWEEESESGYEAFLNMLNSLGVNTNQTRARDPMGNYLPAGYNPLGASPLNSYDTTAGLDGAGYGGLVAVGQVSEMFLAGIDFGGGPENSVYANFEDSWPVASASATLRAVRTETLTPNSYLLSTSTLDDPDAWQSWPKKAISADFSGYALEQVIVAAACLETGEIVIRAGTPTSAADDFTKEIFRFEYPKGSFDTAAAALQAALPSEEMRFTGIDLCCGDFDRDGRKEAILTVGPEVFMLFGLGYIISDSEVDLDFYAWNIGKRGETGSVAVHVAAGDFNQDDYCDWVEVVSPIETASAVSTASYTVYNASTFAAYDVVGASGTVKAPGDSRMACSANVVCGDFDGDGLPEIAFCGRSRDSANYRLMILDTKMDAYSDPVFTFLNSVTEIGWDGVNTPGTGSSIPALCAGNITGGDEDEIFAVSRVFSLNDGAVEELYALLEGNDALYDLAYCADMDGDLYADVLYVDWNRRLKALTVDDGGGFLSKTLSAAGTGAYPAVVPANTTNEGYIYQYLGHYLTFSEPVITAVIASPPYYGDVTYPSEVEYNYTAWGQSKGSGSGVSYGNSIQFTGFGYLRMDNLFSDVVDNAGGGADSSAAKTAENPAGEQLGSNASGSGGEVGAAVSIRSQNLRSARGALAGVLDAPLFIRWPCFGSAPVAGDSTGSGTTYGDTSGTDTAANKASKSKSAKYANITLAGGYRWGTDHSNTVTSTYAYNASAGADVVVFTCVPYDVYEYSVVLGPNGSTAERGAIRYHTTARAAGTYAHTVAYYNAHNGENPDIALSHTVGDPFSYMTTTQMAVVKAQRGGTGLYSTNNGMITGRSDHSYTTQSTSEITSDGKSSGWEVGLKVEVRFCVNIRESAGRDLAGGSGDAIADTTKKVEDVAEDSAEARTKALDAEIARLHDGLADLGNESRLAYDSQFTDSANGGAKMIRVHGPDGSITYRPYDHSQDGIWVGTVENSSGAASSGDVFTNTAETFSWNALGVSIRSTLRSVKGAPVSETKLYKTGAVGGSFEWTATRTAHSLVSTGTYIAAQVPDVPLDAENKSLYKWGVCMYPDTLTSTSGSVTFPYVTYWVESIGASIK